jgi:uncharacterized protein Usg
VFVWQIYETLEDQSDPDDGVMTMSLALQMRDYRLTTAEILYHMPDHPAVLQSYIWQSLDLAPGFPELRKFLDFWSRSLDGKLHSVRVGTAELITPPRWSTHHVLTLQ